MAQAGQFPLGNILSSIRASNASVSENMRSLSEQNNSSIQRMLKDIHRVFSSSQRQNANINSSIEESLAEAQRSAGKIDNTNNLLQQTLSLQSVMLSELKAMNAGIRNLITAASGGLNNVAGAARNVVAPVAAGAAAGAVGAGAMMSRNGNTENNPNPNSNDSNEGGTDLRNEPNLARGMRRNNPTNLIYVGQPGALPPPPERGEKQAVFVTVEEGLAAGARQALINYNRKGLKTPRQMMDSRQGGWAEAREAPGAMASGLGIGLDDDLDLNNPDKLEKFLRQLVKQEQGSDSSRVPEAAYRKAVNSALGGSRSSTRPQQQRQQQQPASPPAPAGAGAQQQQSSAPAAAQPQQRPQQSQVQRQQPQQQANVDPNRGGLPRAPAPSMLPTTPGATMQRMGVENAIGYLHPDLRSKLQSAMDDARRQGMNVSVFSAYRPPGYGVGGFSDKMRSLHSYGLAVDLAGIGRPGSPEAQKWYEIATRHGLYNPYGASHPKEWNHYQLVPYKSVEPDNPLRGTVDQSGPRNVQQMWDAADQTRGATRAAEMQPSQNQGNRAEIINANAAVPQYGPDQNDPSRSVASMMPDQQMMPPMQSAAFNPAIDGNLFGSSMYNPMSPRFSWPLQVLAEFGGRMLRA